MRDHLMGNLAKVLTTVPFWLCSSAVCFQAEGGNEEIFLPKCFPGPEASLPNATAHNLVTRAVRFQALLFDDIKEYCEFMKYTLDDNRAVRSHLAAEGLSVLCSPTQTAVSAVETVQTTCSAYTLKSQLQLSN